MTEELHLSASVDEDSEVLRGAGVLGEVSIFIDSPSREGSGCEAGTGNVSSPTTWSSKGRQRWASRAGCRPPRKCWRQGLPACSSPAIHQTS